MPMMPANSGTIVAELPEQTFDRFREEGKRQGASVEELASYAVVYCVADLAGDRIAADDLPRPPRGSRRFGRTRLTVMLQPFASDVLEQESQRLGLSAEELVVAAITYYVDDADSGRLAHKLPPQPDR
jgi:hypothetical protein